MEDDFYMMFGGVAHDIFTVAELGARDTPLVGDIVPGVAVRVEGHLQWGMIVVGVRPGVARALRTLACHGCFLTHHLHRDEGTKQPVLFDGALQLRVIGSERRPTHRVRDEGYMLVAIAHSHIDAEFAFGVIGLSHGD